MILQDQARAHVIFDCDGTLIDSMRPFYDILVDILPKHLGREITREEVLDKFIPEWVGLLENLGVEEPKKEMIDALIKETSAINLKSPVPILYPGIRDCLQELIDLEVACYIYTGRDRASAIRIFKAHDILKHFTEMSFSDTDIPKPHPDGLVRMLEDYPKDKMVLIGDSGTDIQGAKNFSIPCVGVDWEKNLNHQEFLDFGATHIVKEAQEIVEWVKQNLLKES